MNKFALLAAAAAAISTISVTPAFAQEAQVSVRYGDLDTASPAGMQLLGARLEASATALCGRPDVRDISANLALKGCKDAVVANGIEQLATKGIKVEAGTLLAS
ncbi:MAG: UrcA family protein [Croceibacterium sp.]